MSAPSRPPMEEAPPAAQSRLYAQRWIDAGPDPRLDRLAAHAAAALGRQIGLIALVDQTRLWVKARVGLQAPEIGQEAPFCAQSLLVDALMVVPDARRDDRFAELAAVRDADGIRFFAGAPLIDAEGYRLGTLAVLDRSPGRLEPDAAARLAEVAALVVDLLEAIRALERERRERGRTKAQHGAKAALLTEIGRELRDPMQRARGWADLLARAPHGPLGHPRYADYAAALGEGLDRLTEVIDDVTQLSALDAGESHLAVRAVDLNRLMERAAALVAEDATARGVRIALEGLADAPMVAAHPQGLRRAALSLLDAAARQVEPGGACVVRLIPTQDGLCGVAFPPLAADGYPALLAQRLIEAMGGALRRTATATEIRLRAMRGAARSGPSA